MVDVIVYKPSPYGLVFIHDKLLSPRATPSGLLTITSNMCVFMCLIIVIRVDVTLAELASVSITNPQYFIPLSCWRLIVWYHLVSLHTTYYDTFDVYYGIWHISTRRCPEGIHKGCVIHVTCCTAQVPVEFYIKRHVPAHVYPVELFDSVIIDCKSYVYTLSLLWQLSLLEQPAAHFFLF